MLRSLLETPHPSEEHPPPLETREPLRTTIPSGFLFYSHNESATRATVPTAPHPNKRSYRTSTSATHSTCGPADATQNPGQQRPSSNRSAPATATETGPRHDAVSRPADALRRLPRKRWPCTRRRSTTATQRRTPLAPEPSRKKRFSPTTPEPFGASRNENAPGDQPEATSICTP